MKNLLRKLSIVLALAMVIGTVSPLATALAASAPKLNVTKKTVWVGGKIFDFDVIGDNISDYKISYSVADSSMVKVDPKNGKIRALSVGKNATTTLTATLIHKKTLDVTTLTATVYVKESASSVEITNKSVADELLPVGENVADFDSAMYNAAGQKTTARKNFVTDYRQWTSSDETVATVNPSNGKVTTLKEGTATITVSTYVNSDFSDKNGPTATDSVTIQVGSEMSEIVQKSYNTIAVSFTSDMSKKLSISDFVITNKSTLIRQDIKSLNFTNDGKTAVIEMYLDFSNDVAYEVACGELKREFTAKAGSVSKVVVESGSITYGTPSNVKVSLYDENGVDVTTTNNLSNVTITSDYGYYDSFNQKLTLFNLGDRATVTAVYNTYTYNENGTQITFTGTGSFVAVEAAPVALKSLQTNVGTYANWNSTNLLVALNDTNYYLFAKATYNDDTEKTTGLTFESTDTNKLLIDGATGLMVPIAAGSVVVKVMDGAQVIGTTTVTIGAARTPVSVSLTTPVVKLSKGVADDTASVKIIVKDQYGVEMSSGIDATLSQVGSTPASVVLSATGSAISLDGNMFDTAGTYRYEVTYLGKTQILTINVVTPGDAKSYGVVVENVPSDVKYTNGAGSDNLDVLIKLFSFDASGNKVALITSDNNTGYGYTITKVGASEAAEATPFSGDDKFTVRSISGGAISFNDGTYTVKVYISRDGSGTAKDGLVTSTQFTVANSQPTPAITQEKKTISIGDASAIVSGLTAPVTSYFSINGNGAGGNLTVDETEAQLIGSTLLIKSITIRETFADGNYILHKVVRNYTLSVQ